MDRDRKGEDFKELVKVLTEWRQDTYDSDPFHVLSESEDIIEDSGIKVVAKISPSRLHRDGPDVIIEELGETVEWGSQHVRRMFTRVWRHDHDDSDQVPTYEQL